ncbi:MAG: hypothetical protein ABI644_07055, partial [Arenimonas sp.]
MKKLFLITLVMLFSSCASQAPATLKPAPALLALPSIDLPASAAQGSLVLGHVPADSKVELADETSSTVLKVAANGRIVFGIGR